MFIDRSLLIAALASFAAGVLGYIIARMWIKPIVRYRIVKRRLGRELDRCLIAADADRPAEAATTGTCSADALRHARRHAMDLVTGYHQDVPYWYRLFLDSRGESPADAAGQLTNLSKIRDAAQVSRRIANVRKLLRL